MKLKDYSADGMNSSGSRVPNRAAKKTVNKDKSTAPKTSLTMSKVINQVKHDADTLLTLDELFTALSSLVMLTQPDPNHSGIRDANRLNQIIDEAVHHLPNEYQIAGQKEVSTVQALLSKHYYREANIHVMKWAQAIGETIKNLKEPPQDVQAVLRQKARLK